MTVALGNLRRSATACFIARGSAAAWPFVTMQIFIVQGGLSIDVI
jgi:hypothetical protein